MDNDQYLTKQIITSIGNKRRLLPFIESVVNEVKVFLGKDKLAILDGFSGSGVVSRLFKAHASELHANDLEKYAMVTNSCYLTNKSEVNLSHMQKHAQYLDSIKDSIYGSPGLIQTLYCPNDDDNIEHNERVFYTNKNGQVIDNIRRLAEEYREHNYKEFCFLIAPLLSEASIKTNTSGVFLGFHKDKNTGIGKFGGTKELSLNRIKADININAPILSDHECEYHCYQEDINTLVHKLPELDLTYYDPPYNVHAYGSNYFMLNVICNYQINSKMSRVAGVPQDWNRSAYNRKHKVKDSIDDLIKNTNSKYILLSYNDEGFIAKTDMINILTQYGKLTIFEREHYRYNAHLGRSSIKKKTDKKRTVEYLFLLKK